MRTFRRGALELVAAACVGVLTTSCVWWQYDLETWERTLHQGQNAVGLEHLDRARPLFEASLRAAERTMYHEGGLYRLTLSLVALAELELAQRNPDRATNLLQRALDLFELVDADPTPILYPYASALIRAGELKRGEEIYRRLLGRVQRRPEPHDLMLAEAHTVMAEAYLERGMPTEAARLYEKALQTRLYTAGSRRYDVAFRWNGYATVLDALGRSEEAEDARARAQEILTGSDYVDAVLLRVMGDRDLRRAIRWRRHQMPLRVYLPPPPDDWVSDPELVVAEARRGILDWADLVEPGVPRFEFVDSRRGAHVRVRWERDRGRGWMGHARARKIRASEQPLDRMDVRILALFADGIEPDLDSTRMVIRHEIGHALGLIGHSPYPGDLMYRAIGEENRDLSERDRETLRLLYDISADLSDVELP